MKFIVVFGLLATLAYAAPPMPPMGMPPMMMPQMMLGGMGSMIPPEAMDMIKNLKPEDIKEAIKNMPPEMKDMVKGMGISAEQLDQAINNLPEDLTPYLDNVKENLENGAVDFTKINELPEEMKEKLKENAIDSLKEQMNEMGIKVEDGEDVGSVVDKVKEALSEQLKEAGIDINDPESVQAKMMAEMRKATGATPDESDEEVKIKVAKQILSDLRDDGMDIDPEDPVGAVNKIKAEIVDQLKKMDIDFDEDTLDFQNVPEILKKVIMSGKFGNPTHLMMSAMASFSNGPMQQQMMPPQMPQMQPRGFNMPPYMRGAEDAMWHVYGGDEETMQHVMEVREGAMRGVLNERALYDVLKDLLHYRLETRVLRNQNKMLEERLMFNQMPPYSSIGMRVIAGCRHMH